MFLNYWGFLMLYRLVTAWITPSAEKHWHPTFGAMACESFKTQLREGDAACWKSQASENILYTASTWSSLVHW